MASARAIGPGADLDGFLIEAVAGRGGMGVVYRARQRQPDRIVALKVIAAELADDPAFAARFRREATIAAQIEHPNVIPVYAVGEADGIFYIAMRFVDGVDLRTLLAQEKRLEPRRAAAIVDQAAQALDAAHARGLVHRDIKPANMLISTTHGREHVYLSDFGLSRHVEGSQGITGTGAFLGTIDYVAPEQARGDAVDARTDVYSLGCVLFQALTGTVPYPLDNDMAKLYAHDAQPPPSVLERAPGVPPAFEAVLARAMAKAPDDRYPSAGDLGRAVLAVASGTAAPGAERSVATGDAAPPGAGAAVGPPASASGGPPSPPGGGPPTPWYRRSIAVGGLLAGFVALVVVVVVLASAGGSSNTGTTGGGSGAISGPASGAATEADRNLEVVGARSLRTRGHVLRLVLSRLRLPATAQAARPDPHFLTLFVRQGGAPFLRIQRLKLPWRFTLSSAITDFSLTPNGDGSGNVALSWMIGGGNTNGETHYLTVTPAGLVINS